MPRRNPLNPPAPQPNRLGRTKTAPRPRSLPPPEKVAKYAKRSPRIRNKTIFSPMASSAHEVTGPPRKTSRADSTAKTRVADSGGFPQKLFPNKTHEVLRGFRRYAL